jgi:hypothetical protein
VATVERANSTFNFIVGGAPVTVGNDEDDNAVSPGRSYIHYRVRIERKELDEQAEEVIITPHTKKDNREPVVLSPTSSALSPPNFQSKRESHG